MKIKLEWEGEGKTCLYIFVFGIIENIKDEVPFRNVFLRKSKTI